MADDHGDRFEQSPATRLLDALGRGDLNAALLEFRPTTIVRTEDRTWALQGEEQVLYGLEDALNLFPGLVFDSHARHVGQGRVIEEARVRDLGPLDVVDTADGIPGDDVDGVDGGTDAGASLVLDRDHGRSDTPRLNMPLRLTVIHDDQSVHEIVLSFPRALLRAALGEHVDPLDLAVSEIQSAFVAPVGSGFTTYELGTKPVTQLEFPPPAPEPAPVAPVEPDPEPVAAAAPVTRTEPPRSTPPPLVVEDDDRPRRRAKVVVPLVVLLVGAIAGGGWWLGQGDSAKPDANTKPGKPSHSSSQNQTKPTKKPTATKSPTKPVATKTDKPTVTLKADLAFPKNSAALSDAAKVAIDRLAGKVLSRKLTGTIIIDGYTDNLGSAAHGLTLSQDRAQAVAQYLRSRLGDYLIEIRAFGHGEADPIASNATEEGRTQNRRVTITLPEK
jgi:outer membrane protein OmpA-like peptidoglycan-associated protein